MPAGTRPEQYAFHQASEDFVDGLRDRLLSNDYLKHMAADPVHGQDKLSLLQELGVTWNAHTLQPENTPSWFEIAQNYARYQEKHGLDASHTLVPALVYTKKEGEKNRLQFIDPLRQQLPSQKEGWQLAVPDQSIPFHIPPKAFRRALREGKFPVFFDAHDVNHLLAFMATPGLSGLLIRNLQLHETTPMTPQLDRRNFLALEYLTYPKPDRQAQEFLLHQRGLSQSKSVEQHCAELSYLDEGRLSSYSSQLSQVLTDSLCDMGGASFQSEEKFRYLAPLRNYRDQDAAGLDRMIDDFITPSYRFLHGDGLTQHPVRPFANERVNLVLNINPLLTAAALHVLAHRLPERPELKPMLVRYAAEAESLLLHANTDLPYPVFLDQLMDPGVQPDAPVARLFGEWVTNPALRSVFLPDSQAAAPRPPEPV